MKGTRESEAKERTVCKGIEDLKGTGESEAKERIV